MLSAFVSLNRFSIIRDIVDTEAPVKPRRWVRWYMLPMTISCTHPTLPYPEYELFMHVSQKNDLKMSCLPATSEAHPNTLYASAIFRDYARQVLECANNHFANPPWQCPLVTTLTSLPWPSLSSAAFNKAFSKKPLFFFAAPDPSSCWPTSKALPDDGSISALLYA